MNKNIFKLILFGLIFEISYFNILNLKNIRNNVPSFLFTYSILAIGYLILIYQKQFVKKKHTFSYIKIMIFFAIIFRITMLFCAPSLSDDIYRYIWDGKMQLNGINPYQYAPNAPQVSHLVDDQHRGINHKSIPTIYPPISEFIFFISYRISGSILFFKIVFVIFDLLIMYIIYLILKLKNIDLKNLIIYAWNPLLIIEVAGTGHNDVIAIFFMMASIYLLLIKKETLSIFALTLSFLSKFFPIFLFPIFYKYLKNKFIILISIPIVILSYLPYFIDPKLLFKGLLAYSKDWEFNGFIYSIIKKIVLQFTGDPRFMTRAILGIILIGIVGYLFFYSKNFIGSIMITLTSFLLLTPTFLPWYVLWIIPLIALFYKKSLLYLSVIIGFAYIALIQLINTGDWIVPWWFYIIEFVPFYYLLLKKKNLKFLQ
ncbi:hypothetical protein HOD20_07655 [archaeon]|nr:hypothetical protein [archaeon]